MQAGMLPRVPDSAPVAPSLSEETYRRMRDAIVHGDLRPNERLIEVELAERMETSRTPVRDALQRLSTEGLVRSRRRGWIVHEHSRDEIAEIYEVRAALEGFSAFLAATRATDEQIAHLVALERDAETLVSAPRQALVEANDAFHDALIDAARNDRLRQLTRTSREYFFNNRLAPLYSDDEVRASLLDGHSRIASAIAAREPLQAQQAVQEHILEALEVTLTKLP